MKKYLFAICVLIIFLSVGCDKEKLVDPKENHGLNINFNDLQVGQINTYLRYTAVGYRDTNSHQNFTYQKDTLHVAVTDQEGDFFLVEEYLTRNSEIFDEENGQFFEDTIIYKIKIEGDTLVVQGKPDDYSSYLFTQFSTADWNVNEDRIMKFPITDITNQKTEIKGWKTTSGYSESYKTFFAEECEILGKDFGRVNVIVDNVPMQVDGNGSTYIYNRDFGFVKSFTYGWWVDNGTGWDLLPND